MTRSRAYDPKGGRPPPEEGHSVDGVRKGSSMPPVKSLANGFGRARSHLLGPHRVSQFLGRRSATAGAPTRSVTDGLNPQSRSSDRSERTPGDDVERGFRVLADTMPHLVWTANSAGSVSYFNARVVDYGGWADDGSGYEWQHSVHPDDVEAMTQAWAEAVECGGVYEFEHRILMADGTYRWHLSRAVPVPSAAEPDEATWFGTATDVHSHKLVEQRSADVVRLLQQALRPRSLPTSDRFVLAGGYRPAGSGGAVGGDWYDAFVDRDRLTVVIGDAAGHDIAAAATMGMARHAVATAVAAGDGPVRALTVANDYLSGVGDVFVTCAVVEIDLLTGASCVASAGHLPPVLMHDGGDVAAVEVRPSTPLGVGRSDPITSSTFTLCDTDTLVLYTDGLIERRGLPLDASLGRLYGALARSPAATAEAVASHLLGHFDRLDDDVALLVVRLLPR